MIPIPLLALAAVLAVQGASDAKPPRPRFEFTTFGGAEALKRSDRIVEARVGSIVELGTGSSIVRLEVEETLLPVGEAKPPSKVTVLAHRGEFRTTGRYLVLLRLYRSGGRYVALGRVAQGDRDYGPKRRVLKGFAAVDRIEDDAERTARIRDLLLEHVADEDTFVRWNALSELKALAAIRGEVFGPPERARLFEVRRAEAEGAFRAGLTELLDALGIRIEKEGARG